MAGSSRLAQIAVRGTMIVVLGQALTFALNFLTQRLINVSLSLADNGTFFLIQRITELALIIGVEAGLYNVVLRLLMTKEESERQVLTRAFFQLRLVLWSVVSLGIVFTLSAIYSVTPWATILWCISYGFGARTLILRPVLEAEWRMRSEFFLPTLLSVLESIAVLACLAIDLYVLPQQGLRTASFSVEHVAGWSMAMAVVGFSVAVVLSKQWSIFKPSVSWHHIKMILAAGAPMIISVIFLQVADKVDTLIVETFWGRDSMGVLGVIIRATTPLNVLLIAILTGIFPTLVQIHTRSAVRAQEIFYKLLQWSLWCGIGAATVLSIASPYLGVLLAGEQFAGRVHELWIAFWVLPFSFVIQLVIGVQTAFGQQRFNARLTIAWAVLSALIGYVCIISHAVLGVFIARIITYCMLCLGGCWFIHRAYLREHGDHSATNSMVMLIVRWIVLYGSCMMVSWYCLKWFDIVQGIIYTSIWFVAATAMLRLMSPATLREMRTLVQSPT